MSNPLLRRMLNADQITKIVERELPGVHFRIVQEDRSFMSVLEIQRTVEYFRYPIDSTIAEKPGAPNVVTRHVIDSIRHKATEDYGLTPYIERLKEEAAKEARAAMARALVNFAEQYREKIPTIVQVQDEDDPEVFYEEQSWVAGDLPREVQAVVARAQQLGGVR